MNSIRLNRNEFFKNLEDVKIYVKCLEEQKELLKKVNSCNIVLPEVDINKIQQRFEEVLRTPVTYNAVIISLYGCYEAYIDKISNSLLDFFVSKVVKYNDLPEKIKNKHIRKGGEFLSNPQRFRNFEITEQEVIRNLHICI